MKIIAKGENALIRRNLKKADGTDLLLADLTSLKAELMQAGSVIELVTYPSAKLRQGSTTSQAEYEIDTTVSDKLKKAKASIRWTIVIANAVFSAEGIQKDVIDEDVLQVR